jgi:hypothetical protein
LYPPGPVALGGAALDAADQAELPGADVVAGADVRGGFE